MKALDPSVCAAAMTSLMGIRRLAKAGITHPFGDARTVTQAFPAGIHQEEADPFLMCDYFDSQEKTGPVSNEDEFPVDWHPHRGFDICSYLKSGTGRHGDSLGNRVKYATPGMQWMSTGSGVVHAEGGATEKGQVVQGFQIWINVPSDLKMKDPMYGTVPPESLPALEVASGVVARLLAGEAFEKIGPFETKQSVQMIDFELKPNAKLTFEVAKGLDTTIVYAYKGALASLNGQESVPGGSVVLLDASSETSRGVELVATDSEPASVLLFAGKKIGEPIAWHGPIVMNTQQQISQTIQELRTGTFPPKRVDWDYKRIASKPTE